MAAVEEVETAVGEDDGMALAAQAAAESQQLFPADDLFRHGLPRFAGPRPSAAYRPFGGLILIPGENSHWWGRRATPTSFSGELTRNWYMFW